MGMSGMPTRTTGASRSSNACSMISAEISPPKPCVVVVVEGRTGADGDRLLPDAGMGGSLDRPQLEKLEGTLFEAADAPHVEIERLDLADLRRHGGLVR